MSFDIRPSHLTKKMLHFPYWGHLAKVVSFDIWHHLAKVMLHLTEVMSHLDKVMDKHMTKMRSFDQSHVTFDQWDHSSRVMSLDIWCTIWPKWCYIWLKWCHTWTQPWHTHHVDWAEHPNELTFKQSDVTWLLTQVMRLGRTCKIRTFLIYPSQNQDFSKGANLTPSTVNHCI